MQILVGVGQFGSVPGQGTLGLIEHGSERALIDGEKQVSFFNIVTLLEMDTFRVPVICDLIATVAKASTVPMAFSATGTVFTSLSPIVTGMPFLGEQFFSFFSVFSRASVQDKQKKDKK